MAKQSLLAVVVLFMVTGISEALPVIFDSNNVIIPGDGTVVDMTGGSANRIIIYNSSEFNMSDGTVFVSIESYDDSGEGLGGRGDSA